MAAIADCRRGFRGLHIIKTLCKIFHSINGYDMNLPMRLYQGKMVTFKFQHFRMDVSNCREFRSFFSKHRGIMIYTSLESAYNSLSNEGSFKKIGQFFAELWSKMYEKKSLFFRAFFRWVSKKNGRLQSIWRRYRKRIFGIRDL